MDLARRTLILFILLFVFCASHTETSKKDPENLNEYRKHGSVSFRRIGIAGNYTSEYIRIWEITEDIDAEEQFLTMIEEPKLNTKLYALMGLRIISSDKYEEHRDQLLKIDTPLMYGGGGCIIELRPASEIVAIIDRVKLRDPNPE